MSSKIYSEKAFEEYIEEYLINSAGYIKGNREDYNKEPALDAKVLFSFIETKEYKFDEITKTTENLIFPRYHQIDVVRKLTEDTKLKGAGNNYLIQHSAGSGKSNSIAWLSYRLSSLHDSNDQRIFDTVIVITDRKVLDRQLQDTIYQFEHKQGVVQKIDKDSNQLAESLISGTNIIITTLQKFPFILDKIEELQAKKYAVIVDEAHSSQGGEGAKKMKEALISKTLEEAEKKDESLVDEEEYEDEIRKSMEATRQT